MPKWSGPKQKRNGQIKRLFLQPLTDFFSYGLADFRELLHGDDAVFVDVEPLEDLVAGHGHVGSLELEKKTKK